MASLTIRNLDEPIKARLRVRAAQNGWSMQEEARQILRRSLVPPSDDDLKNMTLADAFAETFGRIGGVDLPEREQEPTRDPPTFE